MNKKKILLFRLGLCMSVPSVGCCAESDNQKIEYAGPEKTEETEKTIHTPLPSDVRLIIYPLSQRPPQNKKEALEDQGLCLVKDIRKISLTEGLNKLILQEIPPEFLEDSLLIRPLENLPLIFTEFSFHSDRLTFENLLEKSVGEEILVTSLTAQKEGQKVPAHLLAIEKGKALVQIGSRIETVSRDRIAFHSIPPNLSLYALLHVSVKSPGTQDSQLELTYMTKGLSWKANYTVEIDSKKNCANMMGWVAIKNTSGVNFRKARIQLAPAQDLGGTNSLPASSQLYPLPLPTSLYNETTKKVAFLSANNIKISREYRIELPPISHTARESYAPLETKIWFAIRNSRQNNLGFLLPAGEIKIYAHTKALKQTRYAGTIPVKHTNVEEFISIPVDTCQLIDAQVQQIDFKQFGASITEAAFRVSMTNKNHQPIQLTLMQPLPPNTTLMRNSFDNHQIVDNTILWSIKIPENQTFSLRYRVRTMREKEPVKPDSSAKPSPRSTLEE